MDPSTIPFMYIFIGIASAVACSMIATAQGVSSGGWFVLGFLLPIVSMLFVSIVLPNQAILDEKGLLAKTHKQCDYCMEIVKRRAVKCRYCHSALEVKEPDNPHQIGWEITQGHLTNPKCENFHDRATAAE